MNVFDKIKATPLPVNVPSPPADSKKLIYDFAAAIVLLVIGLAIWKNPLGKLLITASAAIFVYIVGHKMGAW